MATVRFTAEVLPDGTIHPPEGVHLAPGRAQVTVDTVEPTMRGGRVRDFAGGILSGDPDSADNARLDTDLARAYEDTHAKDE